MRPRRLSMPSVGALGALALGVASAAAVTTVGAAGPAGGGCQLQGQASLNPGLNSSSQPFTYSFSGDLSSCQSNVAGAPASGTVSAGKVVAENVTVTTAGGPVPATFNYQEPVPSGTGGCTSSTTAGEAFVVWADATQTAVGYTTTGALAAVALQGTADPSVVLQPVPGQGITVAGVFYPAPTYTFTTTRYAGDAALGTLAFQPADPTACNTPAGVTQAAISGTVNLGHAS